MPTLVRSSSARAAALLRLATEVAVATLGVSESLALADSNLSLFSFNLSSSFSPQRPAFLLSSEVVPPVMVPARLMTPPVRVTALTLSSPLAEVLLEPKQSSRAALRSLQTTVLPTAYVTALRMLSSQVITSLQSL